tara:strand:- start:101 stop:274 length:174 start_codon:yes stop_codon:yes gene_type:complete
MKYNHAFDIGFEIISNCEQATDVTPAMLRGALLERVNKLSDTELKQACNCFDTHEEE